MIRCIRRKIRDYFSCLSRTRDGNNNRNIVHVRPEYREELRHNIQVRPEDSEESEELRHNIQVRPEESEELRHNIQVRPEDSEELRHNIQVRPEDSEELRHNIQVISENYYSEDSEYSEYSEELRHNILFPIYCPRRRRSGRRRRSRRRRQRREKATIRGILKINTDDIGDYLEVKEMGVYTKDDVNILCSICLEEIDYLNDIRFIQPCCDQVYHIDCIGKWVKENQSCPICKNTLLVYSE